MIKTPMLWQHTFKMTASTDQVNTSPFLTVLNGVCFQRICSDVVSSTYTKCELWVDVDGTEWLLAVPRVLGTSVQFEVETPITLIGRVRLILKTSTWSADEDVIVTAYGYTW